MEKSGRRQTIGLLILYCAVLIWIILFKMAAPWELFGLGYHHSVNLIPFYYDVERPFHLRETLENVIIFIPFGIYLKMLRVGSLRAVLCGFAVSLSLEILQYALGIGASDITDVITNTLGTLIGVGIYGALSLVCRELEKLDRVLRILASVCSVLMLVLFAVLLSANRN